MPVASRTKWPNTDGTKIHVVVPEKSKFSIRSRGRYERLNVIICILIAGWVPSILMMVISYTILTRTLESKILRDRQTFVQLIAHLVGDDLSRTGAVVDYYQTFQRVNEILRGPFPTIEGQNWLNEIYFSHPRIDGIRRTAEAAPGPYGRG